MSARGIVSMDEALDQPKHARTDFEKIYAEDLDFEDVAGKLT